MFKSKVRSAAPSANKYATNTIQLLLKTLFYFTISVCATCSTTTCCFCMYVAEPVITHIITQHIAAFSSTSYIRLYSTAAFIWLWIALIAVAIRLLGCDNLLIAGQCTYSHWPIRTDLLRFAVLVRTCNTTFLSLRYFNNIVLLGLPHSIVRVRTGNTTFLS